MDNDQKQELYQRASFGQEVELFWGSAIGQYLANRVKDQYNEAIAELTSVDPTDSKAVMKAQNKAALAQQFDLWLSQAVTDGLKALDLLESDDVDD